MKNRNGLEATAYHEAGHAVACFLLGRWFRFVTVKPGDDFLGKVVGRASDIRRRLKMAEKGFISIHDAIITAAGPEAERKHTGRSNHRGADGDYRRIIDIARGAGEDGSGAKEDSPMVYAISGAAFKEARSLLDFRWPLVESVAQELLRRETLTHEEFVAFALKHSRER